MKTINKLTNHINNLMFDITFKFLEVISDKRMAVMLALLFANVSLVLAQGNNEMANSLWKNVQVVYQLMSVMVLLALLFFGGKAAMEGMKGEQGAWIKFGSILAVGGIWFFAIPPFISFLNKQGKTNTTFE
jgi:hypothetical protein